jgi:hypothetical protein
MRATSLEVKEAEKEGVIVHNGRSLKRIMGKKGRVSCAEYLDVASFHLDETGQARVETVPGSEQVYDCDTVIFAVGQSPASRSFQEILAPKRSTFAIDPLTLSTCLKGVFAGGDATGGGGSVIEAISAGKSAAEAMDAFLQGLVYRKKAPPTKVDPAEMEVCIPPEIKNEPRYALRTIPKIERDSWNEVSLGFPEETAVSEAGRCLNCAGHLCREVCPYDAPQFGAEENPKMQMCNLCVDRWDKDKHPICVTACPTRAMDAGPVEELIARYGDRNEAEGFTYSPWTKPSVCFKPKK